MYMLRIRLKHSPIYPRRAPYDLQVQSELLLAGAVITPRYRYLLFTCSVDFFLRNQNAMYCWHMLTGTLLDGSVIGTASILNPDS